MTNSRQNTNNNQTYQQERTAGRSSSTTTIHTEPRVCTAQDLEAIRVAYNGTIGPLTAPIAHFLEKCMAAGIEPAVIVDAIERTGWARRPSPFYLRAILQRYLREDIRTMADVLGDEADLRQYQQRNGDDGWREWYQGD